MLIFYNYYLQYAIALLMQLNMESRRLEKVGGLIRGEDYMTALRLREQASIGSLLQTIKF